MRASGRGKIFCLCFEHHEWVRANACEILYKYVFANPIGKVFSENMYPLGPREGRIPDVSLVLNERLTFLERKINLFLASGCRTFWVAYSLERTLLVRRASGRRSLTGIPSAGRPLFRKALTPPPAVANVRAAIK